MMFVVSAKSPEALADYLNKYLDFCLDASPSLFHAICYTSCVGREHYRYRFACIAHSLQDLIGRLEDRIQNPPTASVGNARRILFGFPGQGCQYQGMGRYLSDQYSGFRNTMIEAATKASTLTGYPVLPYLVESHATGPLPIDNSEVAQVCIYTYQYVMASWLKTLGIQAQAVMGHSLGEITAAGKQFCALLSNQVDIECNSHFRRPQLRDGIAIRGQKSKRSSLGPYSSGRHGRHRDLRRSHYSIYLRNGSARSSVYRSLQCRRQ